MNSLTELVEKCRTDLSPSEREALITAFSRLKFLNVKEVALLYGVTAHTVQQWITEGRVQAIMMGPRWMISQTEVLRIKRDKRGPERVLTEAAARHIKHSVERTTDLAMRFGVSQTLVTLIRKGERYSDVE